MYLSAVILFCLGLFVASEAASLNNRIVNGEDADIKNHPYQVSLRKLGRHFCGGSIVSKRHILTAAHCVDGIILTRAFDAITVNTGSSKSSGSTGRAYRIKDAVFHENWSLNPAVSYKDDIALLTLTEDIEFDENTKQINLASKPAKLDDKAVITGWGVDRYGSSIAMPTLKKASMKIIPKDKCQSIFPQYKLYPGHVCAFQKNGVGACSGDSGGPLVVDNEVVGIASWVIPCAQGYPDVYTYVYNYLDWVNKRIKEA